MNARTVEKILDAANVRSDDTVVEIGPGRGALTRPLLARGVRILAFELDERLAAALARELSGQGLTVKTADALDVDAAAALEEIGVAPPVPLVGNLPYESATPMIRAFVRQPRIYSRLVVMVQKEVADRIVALPGADAYGYLTLDVAAHAMARRLFDVSRRDFDPPPLVTSSIVELVPQAPSSGVDAALKVASAGFHARRKTLVNALTPLWGRDRAVEGVSAVGLSPLVRAETLPLVTFAELARHLGPPGR